MFVGEKKIWVKKGKNPGKNGKNLEIWGEKWGFSGQKREKNEFFFREKKKISILN